MVALLSNIILFLLQFHQLFGFVIHGAMERQLLQLLPSLTVNCSETVKYILACTLNVSNNAIVAIPSGNNITLYGSLTVNAGSSFTLNINSS
jgi:hypothetical protein